MKTRTIQITESDMRRLRELLRVANDPFSRDRANLRFLGEELARAEIRPAEDIAPDIVTMNSTVRIRDVKSGEEMVCTVVFPDDADAADGRISVLAPIGAAILGYRVGDSVRFNAPAGVRTLRVEEVIYQPEAVGLYET